MRPTEVARQHTQLVEDARWNGHGEQRGALVEPARQRRSEEHTSELQALTNLVCRLLLEEKNPERLLRQSSRPRKSGVRRTWTSGHPDLLRLLRLRCGRSYGPVRLF